MWLLSATLQDWILNYWHGPCRIFKPDSEGEKSFSMYPPFVAISAGLSAVHPLLLLHGLSVYILPTPLSLPVFVGILLLSAILVVVFCPPKGWWWLLLMCVILSTFLEFHTWFHELLVFWLTTPFSTTPLNSRYDSRLSCHPSSAPHFFIGSSWRGIVRFWCFCQDECNLLVLL